MAINQIGGVSTSKNAAPRMMLDTATRPSAKIITVRRLYRSIHTPAKGPINILGRKATKDAIVKVIADSVWMVSHQITANCTAAEPKIEKACPVYITTNCFFQFFILFIIEISLYKLKTNNCLSVVRAERHNFTRRSSKARIYSCKYVFKHNK